MAIIHIDWRPPPRTLRNFGLIGLVAFAALALLAYLQLLLFRYLPDSAVAPTACVLVGLALYCGLLAPLAPQGLKPLYLLLTLVTLPIGLLVSYAVMGLIFFGIITPVAVVFRIIGRDAMTRKFDASTPTYWLKRQLPTSAERYFRQF